MKAMLLAAGLGTRLRPLTDDRPKALVEVAGRTLLEITLTRLRSIGANQAIVNVHHFSDMVCAYLQAHNNFGMQVEVSREDDSLLDTGGGLKKAAHFFLDDASDDPFLVHNVDVISTIDLNRLLNTHRESGALATLAVHDRKSSRYLLFDELLQLCGRKAGVDQPVEVVRQSPFLQPLAFSGIQAISPRFLRMMDDEGAFSIIAAYLKLAAKGKLIRGFRADEYYWRDLGRPESLAQAAEDLKNKLWS